MRADIKQIRKSRNKIKKGWNFSDHKFENLLDEIYTQLSLSLYDDMATLDFLIRYLDIFKTEFETGEGIVGIDTDFSSVVYDRKYEFLKRWIIKKKIEVGSYFSCNLFIVIYEMKKWVVTDYQVEYLENNIAEIDKGLRTEEYLEGEDNPAFHINNCYRNGDYPNIEKFQYQDITLTLSLILYKKYLKEQLSELNSSKKGNITLQIKGSLSDSKENNDDMVIILPIQQIVDRVKNEISIETPEKTQSISKQEIKLYTNKQVCEMLQVSLKTLNEWRKDGIIIASRLGNKQIRFSEQDIQNAIKKLNVIPS